MPPRKGLDNTSLFTVFNAAALRPWPVRDPGRVVRIHRVLPRGEIVGSVGGFSLAEVRDLASKSKTMSSLIAYQDGMVNAEKQRTNILYVSRNYFGVLGVDMVLRGEIIYTRESLRQIRVTGEVTPSQAFS